MFFDHYPYTNFHNVNLDWILQAVKSWGAMVEQNNQNFIDLQAANESFKEYVTSYITNLDVQDEINHKLDEMLASGALTEYFSPYIKSDVEEWLEENITPTTPPVDATLTISGAAADAKVTGDRIAAVENNLTNISASILSDPIKAALLSLFQKMAYAYSDAKDDYDVLESLFALDVYPLTINGNSTDIAYLGTFQNAYDYISRTHRARIVVLGKSSLGLPVKTNKQYIFTETGQVYSNPEVSIIILNETAQNQVLAHGELAEVDLYRTGWVSTATAYTLSIPSEINGKTPVSMFLVLRSADNTVITSLNDMGTITIREV